MRHGRHTEPLRHMNDDHADALLAAAQALADHPEATAARAQRVDRYGIDLVIETPNGQVEARVEFSEVIPESGYPDGVRVAFVRLARRTRTEQAGGDEVST